MIKEIESIGVGKEVDQKVNVYEHVYEHTHSLVWPKIKNRLTSKGLSTSQRIRYGHEKSVLTRRLRYKTGDSETKVFLVVSSNK